MGSTPPPSLVHAFLGQLFTQCCVTNKHKILVTYNKKHCFLLVYQIVAWGYLCRQWMTWLRWLFSTNFSLFWDYQVTQCMLLLWQRKEALRGKWKHQSFLRPQAFLPHFIGQSKSHGPIQLHASPMEADGGEVINIYWMINLTYDTTSFLILASSFPTGSRTPAKSLQEVPEPASVAWNQKPSLTDPQEEV